MPVYRSVTQRDSTAPSRRSDPAERTAYTRVETKKGQTFASVAARYGITGRQLKWYNPKVTALRAGVSGPV
jgi:LysM repeat protein